MLRRVGNVNVMALHRWSASLQLYLWYSFNSSWFVINSKVAGASALSRKLRRRSGGAPGCSSLKCCNYRWIRWQCGRQGRLEVEGFGGTFRLERSREYLNRLWSSSGSMLGRHWVCSIIVGRSVVSEYQKIRRYEQSIPSWGACWCFWVSVGEK